MTTPDDNDPSLADLGLAGSDGSGQIRHAPLFH